MVFFLVSFLLISSLGRSKSAKFTGRNVLENLVDVLDIVSLVGDQHSSGSKLELGNLADLVDDEFWISSVLLFLKAFFGWRVFLPSPSFLSGLAVGVLK